MSLPESKPKKLWRRTNFNNPTFSSNLMNTILIIPESLVDQPPRRNMMHRDKTIDSLDEARKDFGSLKHDNKERNRSQIILREHDHFGAKNIPYNEYQKEQMLKQPQFISKNNNEHIVSSPTICNSPKKQYYEYYENPELKETRMKFGKLNYLNSKGIQKKQLHAYNILSGY